MFVNKEAFSSKITADMLSRCFNSIEDEVARSVKFLLYRYLIINNLLIMNGMIHIINMLNKIMPSIDSQLEQI